MEKQLHVSPLASGVPSTSFLDVSEFDFLSSETICSFKKISSNGTCKFYMHLADLFLSM